MWLYFFPAFWYRFHKRQMKPILSWLTFRRMRADTYTRRPFTFHLSSKAWFYSYKCLLIFRKIFDFRFEIRNTKKENTRVRLFLNSTCFLVKKYWYAFSFLLTAYAYTCRAQSLITAGKHTCIYPILQLKRTSKCILCTLKLISVYS